MSSVSLQSAASSVYQVAPKKSALKRSESFENEQEAHVKKPALRRCVSFGNLEKTTYSIYEAACAPKKSEPGTLREEERNAKEYRYENSKFAAVPLDKIKDHPKLCITMIQYTIWKTWYGIENPITRFNGQYITALIESALSISTPKQCLEWLNKKVEDLRNVTDVISARQFSEIISQSGWLKQNEEVPLFFNDIKNNTWSQNQEREMKLQIPDLEAHFRALLAIPDLKEAIASCCKQ